ncbi:Iso_dh domain-containing protein [Psidium guajava]|nr:Iso_dh domain-containing protein [Psidium guajava]
MYSVLTLVDAQEHKKMKDLFRNMIKERRNSTGTSDGPGDFLDQAIADVRTEQLLIKELMLNLMSWKMRDCFAKLSPTSITISKEYPQCLSPIISYQES